MSVSNQTTPSSKDEIEDYIPVSLISTVLWSIILQYVFKTPDPISFLIPFKHLKDCQLIFLDDFVPYETPSVNLVHKDDLISKFNLDLNSKHPKAKICIDMETQGQGNGSTEEKVKFSFVKLECHVISASENSPMPLRDYSTLTPTSTLKPNSRKRPQKQSRCRFYCKRTRFDADDTQLAMKSDEEDKQTLKECTSVENVALFHFLHSPDHASAVNSINLHFRTSSCNVSVLDSHDKSSKYACTRMSFNHGRRSIIKPFFPSNIWNRFMGSEFNPYQSFLEQQNYNQRNRFPQLKAKSLYFMVLHQNSWIMTMRLIDKDTEKLEYDNDDTKDFVLITISKHITILPQCLEKLMSMRSDADK